MLGLNIILLLKNNSPIDRSYDYLQLSRIYIPFVSTSMASVEGFVFFFFSFFFSFIYNSEEVSYHIKLKIPIICTQTLYLVLPKHHPLSLSVIFLSKWFPS